MTEKIKDNTFRLKYGVVCIFLAIIAFSLENKIIPTHSEGFSYYASVATFIATLITIMEIFYNVRVTRSIKEQSSKNLSNFKNNAGLSLSHECISYYDSAIENISNEDYALLYAHFKVAFKLHLNLANNYMVDADKKEFEESITSLNELERKITSIKHLTTSSSRLGNKQKQEITDSILRIKQVIESKYTFKKAESEA